MRLLIFLSIFVTFFLIAIRKPFVGFAFYYWMIISNVVFFTYAPPYSWNKYVAIITLVSFVLFELRNCENYFSPIVALLFVIIVWINVTTMFAYYPDVAVIELEVEMKVLLMAIVGSYLLSTPARLQAMVWVIQAGMVIYAVNGMIIIVTGQTGQTPGVPGTLVGGTNEAARALLYSIPLAMYLRSTSQQVWLRWAALAVAVLLSLSLLGTGSRGATVAFFFIASIGVIKSKYRFRWMGVIGVIATVGTFITTTAAFQTWWARFGTTSDIEGDQSFQERVEVWAHAFSLLDERPLLGGGFNIYEEHFDRASHNTFFEWAGEHGLVGLAIFLTLLLCVWLAAGSTIRKTRNRPDLNWAWHLMQAARYVLMAYMVGGLTKNDGFNELMFLIIALVEGTRRVVNRELKVPAKSAAPIDWKPERPAMSYSERSA